MKNISKDGDFVIQRVPDADIQSLTRFIAHQIEANPDKVLNLAQTIVRGDLTQQDVYVDELSALLDIAEWCLVFNRKDALDLCDDLADAIYDELPIHMATESTKQTNHLRLVKICVECHKGYLKGTRHLCERDLV
jgi:hypothetical protein